MVTRRSLMAGAGAVSAAGLLNQVHPLTTGAMQATPVSGGKLVSASTSAPTGLDPHAVALLANFRIARLMYSSVVNLSPTLQVEPGLAESWEQPDELTYIFHLRQNVTFHGGATMDSEDVKYSLERILNEGTAAWMRGSFTAVSSIETPDANTIVLTLSSPFSGFLAAMYNLLVVPKSVADQPADYLMTNADGTGPFMLDSWTPDVAVNLVRNPNYWVPDRPFLDEVEIRVIPDENSILASIETGDIGHYVLEDNKAYENLASSGDVQLITIPAMGTNVVNINHRKAELADIRVRQALSMAMNRDEILQIAGSGVGVVSGPIPPTHELYSVPTSELAFYEQDIEGAKALLAEAGYPDGFALDILYIPTYPLMELSAITLAAQWQAIGIQAEPRSTDIGVWLDLRTATFDYYISTNLDFPTIDPDVYLFDTFHSNSSPAQWDAWSDPDVDALLDQGHLTSDIAARQEIFAQIQKELVERCAAYWTYAQNFVNVLQPNVHGFVAHPSGYPFGYENVWIEE